MSTKGWLFILALVGVVAAGVGFQLGVDYRKNGAASESAADGSRPAEGSRGTAETSQELAGAESSGERASPSAPDAFPSENGQPSRIEAFAHELEGIRSLPSGREKRDRMEELFRKWGESDPESALEAARSFSGRERMSYYSEAIAGWAKLDREAAWQYLMVESINGTLSSIDIAPTMRALAQDDLVDAVRRIEEVKGGRGQWAAMRAIVGEVEKTGRFDRAFEAFLGIGDAEVRERGLHNLFQRWSSRDGDAPLQAIQTIEDEKLRNQAMAGFISGWAQTDALGALSYVGENFDDPAAAQSARGLGRALARSLTGDELLEVVEGIQNPEARAALVSGIVDDLARVDARIAASLLEGEKDEKRLGSQMQRVMQQWAEQDAGRAREYFLSIESDVVKERAIRGFFSEDAVRELGAGRFLEMAASIGDEGSRRKILGDYGKTIRRLTERGQADLAGQVAEDVSNSQFLSPREREEFLRRIAPEG